MSGEAEPRRSLRLLSDSESSSELEASGAGSDATSAAATSRAARLGAALRLCFLQEQHRRNQEWRNPGAEQAAVCAPGPTLTAGGCWRVGRPAAGLRPPRRSSRLHPQPTAARGPLSRPLGQAGGSRRKSLACLPLTTSIKPVWHLINGRRLGIGIAGTPAPKHLRLLRAARSRPPSIAAMHQPGLSP